MTVSSPCPADAAMPAMFLLLQGVFASSLFGSSSAVDSGVSSLVFISPLLIHPILADAAAMPAIPLLC